MLFLYRFDLKSVAAYLAIEKQCSKTSVSSSTPTSATIYDAYTSIIKKKKKKKKLYSVVFVLELSSLLATDKNVFV